MQVIHKLTRSFLKQEILKTEATSNVGFLTANKRGDFASFFNANTSRYNGWFFRNADNLFKIVEDISLIEKEEVLNFGNEFWRHIRTQKIKNINVEESFFLPENHCALVYELALSAEFDLFLDFKPIYSNSEDGRTYTIEQGKKNITIECRNKKEKVFLAIKLDRPGAVVKEQWQKKIYAYDIKRNSPPFEKHVFWALRIKAQKMVLAVGNTKKQAQEEANYVFSKTAKLKQEKRQAIKTSVDFSKLKSSELSMAYYCAQNSLRELIYDNSHKKQISAGLPWFFESYSRDALISMKALLEKQADTFWKICLQSFSLIGDSGLLPNKYNHEKQKNADSIGWLFKRTSEVIETSKVNEITVWKIRKYLGKFFENLIHSTSQEGNWMDSISRTGERIELVALRLCMLKTAFNLTKNNSYKIAETSLRFNAKERFWNGKFLFDGPSDQTIRPNIFLAYYVYPEFLEKKEWQLCFDNALNALWIPWGGVTTIDKSSPYFQANHTGESPQSYHSGDSWFYLNNLTAIVLKRNNPERYRAYIDKILEASTKEILSMGAIGCHTELSSASELKSQGCWSQAWSNAMFIELVREIYSTRRV